MVKRTVMVTSLVLDARLQCRASMNSEAIEDYRELLVQNPDVWPFDSPIEIVEINERLYVTDGFTRGNAAISAGRKTVEANVIQGDWEFAVRRACQANAHNGQRRTREDKRRAVEIALRELPKSSDSVIAKVCMVDHKTVAAIRASLGVAKSENVVGADGKIQRGTKKAKADDNTPANAPAKADSGPKASAKKDGAAETPAAPPNAPDVRSMPSACVCGENSWVETQYGLQCAVCIRGYPAAIATPAAATGPTPVQATQLAAAQTAFGRLVRALRKLEQADSYFGPALDRIAELLAGVPEITDDAEEASHAKGKSERAA